MTPETIIVSGTILQSPPPQHVCPGLAGLTLPVNQSCARADGGVSSMTAARRRGLIILLRHTGLPTIALLRVVYHLKGDRRQVDFLWRKDLDPVAMPENRRLVGIGARRTIDGMRIARR
jgi:hypothetical protein